MLSIISPSLHDLASGFLGLCARAEMQKTSRKQWPLSSQNMELSTCERYTHTYTHTHTHTHTHSFVFWIKTGFLFNVLLFIYLMSIIFKVIPAFVTILLQFYVLVIWPWGIEGSWLPDQGSNLHPCIGDLTHRKPFFLMEEKFPISILKFIIALDLEGRA